MNTEYKKYKQEKNLPEKVISGCGLFVALFLMFASISYLLLTPFDFTVDVKLIVAAFFGLLSTASLGAR